MVLFINQNTLHSGCKSYTRPLMKKFFYLLLLALFACQLNAQSPTKAYEYRNGSWYNGKDFTPGTWYVVNGLLSKKAPSKIDSVVDLLGRWVIPPMGDAFSSSVADNPAASSTLKLYIDEGVFYLQVLSNTLEGREAVKAMANTPKMPDVGFANGGITCTLGFPFLKYEGPAQGIRNPAQWTAQYEKIKAGNKMLGNAYWFIDNKTALEANWPKIKAQNPGVISIYLLDAAHNGGKEGKGLSEETAKLLIKKAHKADLRVYAHVETAEDVQLAIKLGIDGIANLPGNTWDGSGDAKRFEISDDDLKKLAKKKIPVITALSHAQGNNNPAIQELHMKTLRRLVENNVWIALGSDDMQRTGRAELNYWFNLNNLSYETMLHIMCENTPRAIFPNRKIGKIADGYEASFVVLSDNPLVNILKTRAIAFKIKNGKLVN